MACSRSTLLCVVPPLCRRTRREKSRRQGRCRRPRRRRASPTPPRRLRPRHARLGKIEVLIYWLVIVKRIVTGYNVNEEWRMKSVRELAPRTKKTLAFAPPRPACAGAALAPLRYALPPYGGWQRAWAASTWAFRRIGCRHFRSARLPRRASILAARSRIAVRVDSEPRAPARQPHWRPGPAAPPLAAGAAAGAAGATAARLSCTLA